MSNTARPAVPSRRPAIMPRPTPGDQLRAQLRYRILAGELRRGDRLPPVRRLARFLRVNRNTVAQVYRRLEAEGFLATAGRRGTFVRRRAPLTPAFTLLLDRVLAEAERETLSAADLQTLLTMRARPKIRGLRLGFVECNTSDLAYFGRLVEAEVGAAVHPLLLDRLPRAAAGCDLLITTFFHLEEVRRRVPGREVIGLVALPDFRTLEEVAGLPRRARVALVCATEEGVRSKARSLRAVGLQRPRLRTATLAAEDALRKALADAEVLLASPKVLDRLSGRVPPGLRVIPFASTLSEGAVALLRERLAAAEAAHGPTVRPRRALEG